MVSGASPALTKISFRRDVRLFFGALVGFLAVLILLLIVLLQSFLERTREVTWSNWTNIAQAVSDQLAQSNSLADPLSAQTQLTILQERYGIAGITIVSKGRTTRIGLSPSAKNVESLVRTVQGSTLIFVFDAAALAKSTSTFRATAVIALFATSIAALLLGFYLPRITRPIEAMLDTAAEIEQRDPARDEQQYIIETFRKTIATLKAQEAAQKSRADDLERVTAALTRSLTSGFVAVDPNGKIVEVNRAAREMLEVAADASGMTIENAFGASAFTDAIRRAVDDHVSMSRVEVDAGDRTIGLTTVPLVGEQQQFLGVIALFTDLTQIRSLESRIRDMQTLADLGEISAGIAHEFRNSLGVILGYLRLARAEDLAAKPLTSIERAEREAGQLSSAVDSLLAFARPMHLAKSEVDLLQLAEETVEKIGPLADVRIECSGDPVVIDADRSLLGRAIDNLVRNAVDSVHQKGGGRVDVRVAEKPHPSIRVEDDGIGLDPADVPRLLLPFQSGKPTGYGLGLPLSRKIALLHDATLTLTGRPGVGATATIEFLAAIGSPAVQFVTTEAR